MVDGGRCGEWFSNDDGTIKDGCVDLRKGVVWFCFFLSFFLFEKNSGSFMDVGLATMNEDFGFVVSEIGLWVFCDCGLR